MRLYNNSKNILVSFALVVLSSESLSQAASLAPPAAPASVSAAANGDGTITVKWSDTATNETGYQIQYTSDGKSYTVLSNALAAGSTSFIHKLTSTTPAKYTYQVRAINSAGASAWANSNGVSAAALSLPADPSNVTATLNSAGNAIQIQWADNANNEGNYEIRYTTDGASFTTLSSNLAANTTTYTHAISPTVSKKYTYSVRAVNAAGTSNWAQSNGVSVIVLTPPAAPVGVTASVNSSANTIQIQWQDVASTETNYEIQYTTNGTTQIPLSSSLAAGTTSYIYPLTSTSKLKYTFSVRATNSAGSSAWSASNAVTAAYVPVPKLPGPSDAYVIDNDTHTMTVNPIGDYTSTLNMLLGQLVNRTDPQNHWALRLMAGTYNLTGPLTANKLVNADITSVDTAHPASLVKGPDWAGEYILLCLHCDSVQISYLGFTGLMSEYDPKDNEVHWKDQGVWLGSTKNMKVNNSTFTNIGNAAIRVNTELNDPIQGVNSFYTWIEDNTFTNIWQVTTTTDNTVTHGGTSHFWFQRNKMTDLRGSIKFCSRTAGGTDGHILNNKWEHSSDDGVELCSVSNVEVRGNTFNNIDAFILNAYTNTRELDNGIVKGFQWGDDITVADNVATNVTDGLRFSLDPYLDGYKATAHRLKIDNNTITTVNNAGVGAGPVRTLNGAVQGVSVTNNKLNQVANHMDWSFMSGTTDITMSGNTVDGVPANTP